jgi:hypothetical protein
MDHHTYMLFNIHSCIQYESLSHTLHINISSINVRLSVSVIHQKSLPLPCNVEPGYHTTIEISKRDSCCGSTHLIKCNHTSENATTSSSKISRLKYEFFFFSLICCSTFTLLSNVDIYYITIISPSRMTKF